MKDHDRIIIQKIIQYSTDALNCISGCSYDNFVADKKTVFACAFAIGQIGELANLLSEETKTEYATIPWRSIRGMRNRVVHDYNNVDMAVLWSTISESLPELIGQLEGMLHGM